MRIALFHATLPEPGRKLGGVEVAVHRLASELARHPDDTVTVYSSGPQPEGSAYEHRRLAPTLPVASTKLGRLTLLSLLLNAVDFADHDVLHLHGDDWFFLRRRLPTVRTMHGSALREAESATSLRRRLLQRALYPLEHLSARLADVTLAVGRDAAALYGTPHLADNGVDLDVFRPGPKRPVPTILFVGTWHGRKRGEMVHRAYQEVVRPALPEAELVMVSDHCEQAPGVRHVPYASDRDLAELYRAAWVFAYPSRYEGFGIPYIEAMASGTPILTTANDGAGYVLDDGRYGVVATETDFALELLRLLGDEERRHRLTGEGLARADRFSWSRVAAEHRRQYGELLAKRRGGSTTAMSTVATGS